MSKKRKQYNARQRKAIYAWRRDNPEAYIASVRRAQAKAINTAREILAGSITEVRCVVPGCPAEPSMLQFHHINGDGKKLKDRTQHTTARWIIKNDVLARKTIELRCFNHHRRADAALGIIKVGAPKLTEEQVQHIRLLKRGNRYHPILCKVAKQYGISRECMRRIRTGQTWKWLPWPEAK